MKASFKYLNLKFKNPSGTSRGVLKTKDSWFLLLKDKSQMGIGECSIIEGLSIESKTVVVQKLEELCILINKGQHIEDEFFKNLPAIRFAFEMAMMSIRESHSFKMDDNNFINGQPISINGLVWMGDISFMKNQIIQKVNDGYQCIKIKVAALEFEEELNLLKWIRKEFAKEKLELRLDANGGFSISEVYDKLDLLNQFQIHSIEQPIAKGYTEEMALLVEKSPIDIALDEELIGVDEVSDKEALLEVIKPQYIILKPTILGGFQKSLEWIRLANQYNISWWVTSALESNVGLNAIAQWTSALNNQMYQGLGTGQLFTNNITSPLYIDSGQLHYGTSEWKFPYN